MTSSEQSRSPIHVRDAIEPDLRAIAGIRSRSFGEVVGDVDAWIQRNFRLSREGRMLVATDADGEVLGSARAIPFRQAWRGRLLPMGGVAGVYVDPAARGLGIASALTRSLLHRMAELGDVVSCLYPTTTELYRGAGYELGGVQRRITVPGADLRSLGRLAGARRPRRAQPSDAGAIRATIERIWSEQRLDGPVLWPAEAFDEQLADPQRMSYLTDDGFVSGAVGDGHVTVDLVVAGSAETEAALWSLMGSGSSANPRVHAYVPAHDPLLLRLAAQPETEVQEVPWMARVVDLPAAVAARGCAPTLAGRVLLRVADEILPGNDGTWALSAEAGRLHAERTDEHAAITVGPRGLAALWCGWSLPRLRLAELASGSADPADESLLEAMLAAEPVLPDYF